MTFPWKRREVIGDAVLYLGDCLEILPTLPKVDAVITDPPYVIAHVHGGGIAYTQKFYREGALNGLTDFRLQQYAGVLAGATDQLVAFHSRDQIGEYAAFCGASFGKYDLHVWHKRNAIPFVCNTWKSDLEYIALGWRSKKHAAAQQHEKSKLYSSGIETGTDHPAQKPLALMEKYIKILDAKTVLDPFMGSGTTGVACAQLGRRFIGIEIEPKYFDIAVERIDNAYRQAKLFPEEKAVKPEQMTL